MNGFKGLRFGLMAGAAAAIVAGAGLLASSPVSAQGETIAVSSAAGVPGAQVSVALEALSIGAPGLGAWTIDVTYDPAVLSPVGCSPGPGGVCNSAYGADTVRVSGASATGLAGDNVLATISFQCEVEGSSALTPSVNLLADATIGDPQTLEATTQAGSVTCSPAAPTSTPGPTTEPAATATPSESGLPIAGTGSAGTDGGGTPYWLVAGLTGAGLAWLLAILAGAGLATVSGPGVTDGNPSARTGGRSDAGVAGGASHGGGTRSKPTKTGTDAVPHFVALRRRERRR